MSANFDFGFCQEILALLAVNPAGIDLDEVRKQTADRVRAKKTFDAKFQRSLGAILADAPYRLETHAGTQVIVPKTAPPRPAATPDATPVPPPTAPRALATHDTASRPFDAARFRAIILGKLMPIGTAKPESVLEAEVKAGAEAAGMTFQPFTFEPIFLGTIAPLVHANPPQVVVTGDLDADPAYCRIF